MNKIAFLNKNKLLLSRMSLALGLFFIATISFVALADMAPQGETLPFDDAVLRAIHQLATPALDSFFVAYTNLGGVAAVGFMTVLLAGYLAYKRYKYKALLVVAGVGGAALINFGVKFMFARVRPDLWTKLVAESSFSFPSGHAMVSSALALSVVAILWNTKWRGLSIVGAGLYMVSIGFSRLYLGLHYPTDILGGWLLSFMWVSIMTTLIYARIHGWSALTRPRSDVN